MEQRLHLHMCVLPGGVSRGNAHTIVPSPFTELWAARRLSHGRRNGSTARTCCAPRLQPVRGHCAEWQGRHVLQEFVVLQLRCPEQDGQHVGKYSMHAMRLQSSACFRAGWRWRTQPGQPQQIEEPLTQASNDTTQVADTAKIPGCTVFGSSAGCGPVDGAIA